MKDRAAAILIRGGEVLMLQRRNERGEYYVLPGGSIEPGETPEQACVRELREESELRVTIERKVAAFENEGRSEHYFLVTASGKPVLSGPEAERNSPADSYAFVWVSAIGLAELPVRPARVVELCRPLIDT